MRLVVNDEYVDGTIGFMYNRRTNEGYNTATISILKKLNIGDKIKMQVIRISGNGVPYLASEACGITIVKN
jgi:hypothetical protein